MSARPPEQRSAFLAALRSVLFEDPSAIEGLSPGDAAHADRLLESNGLEAAASHLAALTNVEERISPPRLAAWRTARLLAQARYAAYREALDEVLEISRSQGIPVRLVGPTQTVFAHLKNPELRPLASLDVQAPAGKERALVTGLKSRRFFESEELVHFDASKHPHLHPLVRDGVTVKVHRITLAGGYAAPWDEFPAEAAASTSPLALDPEALLFVYSRDFAARRYTHSLSGLHDLAQLFAARTPHGGRVLALGEVVNALNSTSSTGSPKDFLDEVRIALFLLSEVFDVPIDEDWVRGLEARTEISPPRWKLLCKISTASLLQYPASLRLVGLVGKHIEGVRIRDEVAAEDLRG